MSRETIQICDRCGHRAPGFIVGAPSLDVAGWRHITPDIAKLLGLNPMQEGDLCPTCAGSLRNWWGSKAHA